MLAQELRILEWSLNVHKNKRSWSLGRSASIIRAAANRTVPALLVATVPIPQAMDRSVFSMILEPGWFLGGDRPLRDQNRIRRPREAVDAAVFAHRDSAPLEIGLENAYDEPLKFLQK